MSGKLFAWRIFLKRHVNVDGVMGSCIPFLRNTSSSFDCAAADVDAALGGQTGKRKLFIWKHDDALDSLCVIIIHNQAKLI